MKENNNIAHENYMRRCFQLAKLGESFTAPNPMVGAVLVYEDRIIGEGYHQRYGEAHAEVNCLASVKEADKHHISTSTLYVSLEPCVHHGKTPPCTDLIIRHRIPKVVISVEDNFHLVSGKGMHKLRENNIEVVTGILPEEGKSLLKHFIYFHQHKMPYVTLKFAQSKDGYMGIAEQRISISNELSKRYVHKLRAQHQAILVGKNTVMIDNPILNTRYWAGKDPIRIILGDENSIPKDHHIFNKKVETIFISGTIGNALKQIGEKNIISILVEGGANTIRQFLEMNVWNEAHVITSNTELNNGIHSPVIPGKPIVSISLEDNTVDIFENTPASI